MICPLCGAADHEVVTFNGFPVLVCPLAPKVPAITTIDKRMFEDAADDK